VTIISFPVVWDDGGGGTTRMSGTIMASPHVAGVVALIYANYPNSTADGVLVRIVNGTRVGAVPLASPTSCYTPDGDLEGVVSAAAAQ